MTNSFAETYGYGATAGSLKIRKGLIDRLSGEGWKPVADWNKVPSGATTRVEPYSYEGRVGKDSYGRFNESMTFFKEGSPAQAQEPAVAPVPAAPTPPPPATPSLSTQGLGNPDLTIPGVSARTVGENIGIKAKRSSASKSGGIGKGTSRLIIPRSSGSSQLNI